MQKIALAKPKIGKTARRYVAACFDENRLTTGRFNTQFEELFAAYTGTKHAVSAASGTVALTLALKAVGVRQGDEVIMPTLTFVAVAEAIILAGGTPVFADVEEGSWNIDPKSVEKLVTKKTRAVIAVHSYGVAADLDALRAIAKERKIALVEDAAEALGAYYHGKRLGSIGDVGAFSFYGNKIITTGEGGMATTSSAPLAKKLMLYRNHGMSAKRYWHLVPGKNGKLSNLHAAIGVSQMEDMPKLYAARLRILGEYREELEGLSRVRFAEVPEDSTVSPWFVTVRIVGMAKEKVVDALEKRGIESRPGFYPCHLMPAFKSYVRKGQRFPIAEKVSREIVNLPTHSDLTRGEVAAVCRALRAIIR